nr:gamma-glutamylcyclotransferase [Mesorhizobium sp.]
MRDRDVSLFRLRIKHGHSTDDGALSRRRSRGHGLFARPCPVFPQVEPLEGAEVWGAVYRLTAIDLALLDQKEGYQPGRNRNLNSYTRLPVMVTMNGVATEMQIYVAEPQAGMFLPDTAYLRHIRDGARHHKLPDDYLAWLETLASSQEA